MGVAVVYGANSFLGAHLRNMQIGVVAVGNRNCNYTYEQFADYDNPISAFIYCQGRAQSADTKLADNPDLFEKNTFEFFRVMERINLTKFASVVYVSSGHAHRASPANPYYAASKAAVDAYVVSQSLQFARMNRKDNGTRRINSVAPEAFLSPMTSREMQKARVRADEYIASRPNFRLLSVQEVAAPIHFLASQASSGINGQIIIVGGVK